MKSIASTIVFCFLFMDMGLCQPNSVPSPQPTPLEAFAHQPSTHVAWSKQVGSLDSSEAHAVVTALVLEDTAQPPDRMRGIRIDLSSSESSDVVYLGEETLGVYKNALDEIGRNVPGSRTGARDNLSPGGISYLGACVFRSEKPTRIHSLSAAHYLPPDSAGPSIPTFTIAGSRFRA